MSEQHATSAIEAPHDSPIIQRLLSESASPAEWRREALAQYADGCVDECRRILEAALNAEQQFDQSALGPQHIDNMYLLAELYLAQAVSRQQHSAADAGDMLVKAKLLLDRADAIDISLGSTSGVESFVAKGFHAVVRHVMQSARQGDELKRAEILFDAALKMDSSSPKALLGKAIVFTQYKEWAKALGHFRQVLKRAAPLAPRAGLRLQSLKQLRFALAACFCDLGRYTQMRNALGGVVAADPTDVESLCALAHLEAKVSKDGVGKSLEYLDEAVKANQNHPVVLCHLANHAFYCGLEQGPQACGPGSNGEPSPWDLAHDLLSRASASTKSTQVQAEVHYQLGRLEHARGRYCTAYQEYHKCSELHAEHIACMYGLAQTCIQQQKYSEAISGLEQVRKGRGELPEVLKLLTFAYLMSGDRAAEAVKCADALVAKDKEDMEALAMRAEAHDQLSAQEPALAAPRVGIEVYEQVARLLEESKGTTKRGGCASPQMWNNLGTLRGLQGDPHGAKEAYNRGLELAERRLVGEGGGPSSPEEAKDLHIARLTMRFNCAWLAENEGDHPNYMQATQDYMAINEEHNWYADSLLQLGAQWQRMGEVEIAIQRYQEAMKSNPVLSTLMQAELYRHRADYSKALQSAELAVQFAEEKQFHYVHVYLGNLYFEVASAPSTKPKDRDAYMHKALRSFTKALEHKKDSHYAANGIGMVFAHRGKLDFARRTFQSVMQHHAMAGDPSVFINLGHTYLQAGGDNARKALASYERAKKLKPNDLAIRLYLAKAHFRLKEFDRCTGVLGDATQIWPDDLLLRYNLAISLESFGVHLVSEERKTRRVVGVDNGMQQMNHAIQLLSSAARLFDYVYRQWIDMTDQERKRLIDTSGASDSFADEMLSANAHKMYCKDIQTKAQEELVHLQAQRAEIDRRMQENAGQKEEEQRRQIEHQQLATISKQDDLDEDNDRAKDLEEKAKQIDLGKNLELRADTKKAPKPKEPREKKTARGKPQTDAGVSSHAPAENVDAAQSPASEQDEEKGGRRGRHKKKEKKGKKEKDGKRGHKRSKKEKKRTRDEDGEDSADDEGGVGSAPENADQGAETLVESEGGGEQEEDSDEGKQKKEKKDKRRHQRKGGKKDKKHHKKDRKRRKTEGSDSDGKEGLNPDADAEELFAEGPEDQADDKAMEEELFGSDGDM